MSPESDDDILRHEISEDGVHWRPYDPRVDPDSGVHRRIEFAPPAGKDAFTGVRASRATRSSAPIGY
jgi:hypothetical protein